MLSPACTAHEPEMHCLCGSRGPVIPAMKGGSWVPAQCSQLLAFMILSACKTCVHISSLGRNGFWAPATLPQPVFKEKLLLPVSHSPISVWTSSPLEKATNNFS